MVAAHLHQQPVPLRLLRTGIPAPVEAVVLRALSKHPAARFPDAEGFARRWAATPSPLRRGRGAGLVRGASVLAAAGALALGAGLWWGTRESAVLDPNRVLVLPIAGPGPDSSGQRDAATLALIASLNSTSTIVGLDGGRIASAGPLAPARAHRLARAQRAAFLVDGSPAAR